MAKKLQLRRGNHTQNASFKGAVGELTIDTERKDLRVHIGDNVSGGYLVPTLIAVQYPNSGNNYTWYRKWSDGWVEQGGIGTSHQYNQTQQNVNFPVTMKDTLYQASVTAGESTQQSWMFSVRVAIRYTNGMDIRGGTNGNSGYTGPFFWEVRGLYA